VAVCDYCGTENDNTATFCLGCGAVLEAEVAEAQLGGPLPVLSRPKPRLRELNAGSATVILLAGLGTQLLCGLLIALILYVTEGNSDYRKIVDILNKFKPTMMVILSLADAVATIVLAKALIPEHLQDTTPNGGAWVRGDALGLKQGIIVGMALGLCACSANMWIKSHLYSWHLTYGDTARSPGVGYDSGFPHLLSTLRALIIAPTIEELKFRGVVYGGYRKSFGSRWAAVPTTAIFIAFQAPVIVRFPLNFMTVGGTALAALWCRLRWNAVAPAVAVHMGYNAVLIDAIRL
jgi:membrane protease YdiL (CAAX protease family)